MDLCIADNLRFLRQKNGYSMESLAEIISVTRQTIAKWEMEESYPDIMNCMKLASLYKITLDELVNKPFKVIKENEFAKKDDKVCGVLEISKEGDVRIPQSVLDMFDIQPGGKILLLADKNQGIAMIKCTQFEEEI